MPNEDKPERRADTRLEALLRGRGLLDPGDDIAGTICAGGGVLLSLAADQTEPTARDLDKGCCCAFSSRRLYLLHVKMTVDLERVWRAECWGTDLALVFSAGEQLTGICLAGCVMPAGPATAAQVAAFADRVLAQRDQWVAGLPQDAQQRYTGQSAELERQGVLEAALAELIPHPRTRIGGWVRGLLLRDPEEMTKYRSGTGWSSAETPVLWAAFILQVRRFFGTSTDAGSVSAFMSSLAALLAERGRQLDLVQADAMVRWALGGPVPELSGLAQDQQLAILAVVAGFVAEELQLTPKAIWLLVIRSEQMTLAGGLNLPPSSSGGTGGA